jgi:hypothetical protein
MTTEGEGLEPPRACAQRFSRPPPYQLGLALPTAKPNAGCEMRGVKARDPHPWLLSHAVGEGKGGRRCAHRCELPMSGYRRDLNSMSRCIPGGGRLRSASDRGSSDGILPPLNVSLGVSSATAACSVSSSVASTRSAASSWTSTARNCTSRSSWTAATTTRRSSTPATPPGPPSSKLAGFAWSGSATPTSPVPTSAPSSSPTSPLSANAERGPGGEAGG